MKNLILFGAFALCVSVSSHAAIDHSPNCGKPVTGEPIVYSSEFHWGYTLKGMQEKFDEMYASGKRLQGRAYYDEAKKQYILPHTESQGGDVVLSERMIQSVRKHIEAALTRKYVQNIFFPDMGHSHFFIPRKKWEEKYAPMPVPEMSKMYGLMLDDPELKVLYHTAEQVQTLNPDKSLILDRELQWRFYTRNLVGDNRGEGNMELLPALKTMANTAGEEDMPGYAYFGGGFNLHATKDGCFPYTHEGKTLYFDLSLEDLPYPATSNTYNKPVALTSGSDT